MPGTAPLRTRVYRNHHLDSRRWDRVRLRPGDVVISTSYKAGTTWTQRIVSLLVFGTDPLPGTINSLSPWIDARFHASIDAILAVIEAQSHRRFLKSHLPLDALPYDPRVKYLYVGRDGRDVFMSLWNHYRAYNDFLYERLNTGDDLVGGPLPRCPEDIHALFDGWVHRASFPWELDGYPMWSHLYHVQSFWDFRRLENLHFVHFADLKADLAGEMRRIAAFLEIPVPEERWPALVEAASFASMKRQADVLLPELALGFQGGAQAFLYKGTNERWRSVLSAEELASYDAAVERTLAPTCAAWLAQGGAAGEPKAL